MSKTTRQLPILLMIAAILVMSSCGEFGYTNRVLLRVASPDGKMVAVCQEVPAFDGPGYEVRLEDNGGRVLRRLYESGEAESCDELRWAGDGRRLGVMTRHSAIVWIVDVEWALAHPDVRNKHAFVRIQRYTNMQTLRQGLNLGFVTSADASIDVCPYTWEEYRRTGKFRCTGPAHVEVIPAPATPK